jgi:hypothetical protein
LFLCLESSSLEFIMVDSFGLGFAKH